MQRRNIFWTMGPHISKDVDSAELTKLVHADAVFVR